MRYFRDLIRSLKREGKTIFLSSHLLSEVEQLCQRVGIIDRGKIVAVDTIADLTSRLAVGAPTILHVAATGVTEVSLSALRGIPGVTNVQETEVGVDITAESASDVSAEVSKALVLAGAQLRELRAEQRSLEDLFLALTKGGAP